MVDLMMYLIRNKGKHNSYEFSNDSGYFYQSNPYLM